MDIEENKTEHYKSEFVSKIFNGSSVKENVMRFVFIPNLNYQKYTQA
jgi:hypothetical protein